jgi:hypothetical protein
MTYKRETVEGGRPIRMSVDANQELRDCPVFIVFDPVRLTCSSLAHGDLCHYFKRADFWCPNYGSLSKPRA